jgi:hypothetical protein
MKRATIVGGVFATMLVLLGFAAAYWVLKQDAAPATTTFPAMTPSTAVTKAEAHPDFLYGRITTDDGAVYEGRLRWGGNEEAFWGDYFNGAKVENPWVAYVPPEQVPKERRPIKIFGREIVSWDRQVDLGRPFMARLGDIARIETRGHNVQVTLKSRTVTGLDYFSAGDFADVVRVWDGERGIVDLDSGQIVTIELLPAAEQRPAPQRLHGTVRTKQGDFTGFVQWDRQKCIGDDELTGQTSDRELSLRFDTIRSIARRSSDSSVVTLRDDRDVVLSGTRDVGQDNRGIYVDDQRYGRVLISWDAFERVDFSPGSSGPTYDDFPRGRPLTGTVATRAGRRLAGRLVYDLDESETTETLDAPSRGVDYTIPFGLIASIMLSGGEEHGVPRARVTLHDGEALQLERTGDLGVANAGMLIFVDGRERPEYVPWTRRRTGQLRSPTGDVPTARHALKFRPRSDPC